MSTRIRYYDKNGSDITALVEANAAMGAAQFTLRDFFAGCALIAESITSDRLDDGGWPSPIYRAADAYTMADVMLNAREDQ